jgi:hypothetical protein
VAVLHDFECMAHGYFEARVGFGKLPRCPKGCSSSLVKQVRLKPPGFVSARSRKGDKLVREMAEAQGLSDISTSPSRSGGSVAERNRAKSQGAKENPYPPQAAAQAPSNVSKFLGALTHKENALANSGFGNPYNAAEWKKDDKTGAVRHVGRSAPNVIQPPAVVERVRGKP